MVSVPLLLHRQVSADARDDHHDEGHHPQGLELPDGLVGEKLETLKSILLEDPRPHYQNDNERVYAFEFADWRIKFTVNGSTVTVTEITDI